MILIAMLAVGLSLCYLNDQGVPYFVSIMLIVIAFIGSFVVTVAYAHKPWFVYCVTGVVLGLFAWGIWVAMKVLAFLLGAGILAGALIEGHQTLAKRP